MGRWTTTYREACTATHVRGEQSEEILDLRMQCLSENLDEVRALTEALLSAQPSAVAQATTAVEQLSPVGRCSDIPSLRSAVPLPRDERTRRTVQELRRAVNDVSARLLLFQTQEALGRAIALRPAVEATGYRPLLAQLLEVTGGARIDAGSPEAEGTLEHALFEAEAGRDDETAARAAIDLVFEVGYAQAKPRQADVWANLASAILDRLGPGHEQLQSWLFQDRGIIRTEEGDFRAARHFFEQALMLKERTLGPDSPDVARTLTALAWVLNEEGSASEALVTNTRALAICKEHGISCSNATDNQGEILAALGRYTEAEGILKAALRLAKETRFSRDVAHPLTALAEVRMAQGDSRAAVQLLEQALLIREQDEPIPDLVAVTQFALARALWESGGDRHRARALAGVAADTFASHGRPNREKAARDWLGSHSAGSPSHP
jgi:serine/threonine-protein kinase